MTPPLSLAVLLACSAVTLATLAGWALTAMLTPLALRARVSALARAALLAQLRLLPLACVVILVPTQIMAFARFESTRVESAGPLLIVAAVVGALLALHALWLAVTNWYDTRRIVTTWRATATPMVIAQWTRGAWMMRPIFPIVAVAGVLRPQLFVARQSVDSCTPAELGAIAAHERAHVIAQDNLVRFLFRLTPGARLCRRVADRLEQAWIAAAEEAADLTAGRLSSPIELAAALTKVVRLAAATPPVTVSALIDGNDLHTRVHRLLDGGSEPRRRAVVWLPAIALIGVAAAFQLDPVAAVIHEAFELLVRRG